MSGIRAFAEAVVLRLEERMASEAETALSAVLPHEKYAQRVGAHSAYGKAINDIKEVVSKFSAEDGLDDLEED